MGVGITAGLLGLTSYLGLTDGLLLLFSEMGVAGEETGCLSGVVVGAGTREALARLSAGTGEDEVDA